MCHLGPTLGSGHYNTFVLDTEKYVNISDEKVG